MRPEKSVEVGGNVTDVSAVISGATGDEVSLSDVRDRAAVFPTTRTLVLRPAKTTSLEDTDARSRIATAERPRIVR
ncbi:hypothetical protein GCM10026982_17750 [Nocardiopsis aegyptia]